MSGDGHLRNGCNDQVYRHSGLHLGVWTAICWHDEAKVEQATRAREVGSAPIHHALRVEQQLGAGQKKVVHLPQQRQELQAPSTERCGYATMVGELG